LRYFGPPEADELQPESRSAKNFWTPALVRLRRLRRGDGFEDFLRLHQLWLVQGLAGKWAAGL